MANEVRVKIKLKISFFKIVSEYRHNVHCRLVPGAKVFKMRCEAKQAFEITNSAPVDVISLVLSILLQVAHLNALIEISVCFFSGGGESF